ncbi:hypothetical protein [Spirosoma rhododendri]|uniref:Glycosyltransferase n=1 Tax=Spirosoma rhododendri TaxID=2728024 RepID=A0A7L5DR98_9BACT|nr:hypothetical protein [Spirosoma rhododendri]QJD80122.1 hypothetical protein HH216_18170 [Spirosoma rhododendri]
MLDIPVGNWADLLITNGTAPTDLLLHFTPASYARTGLPIRLVRAVRRFRKSNPLNRLFILVHEAWSDELAIRPHHLARNRMARWSAGRMGQLADGVTVMTIGQQTQLTQLLGGRLVVKMGTVGANVLPSEPEQGFLSQRQPGVWATFGMAHTRLWAMQAHKELLQSLFERGHLTSLLAIGPVDNTYADQEAAFAQQAFGPGKLVQLGALSPGDVSKHLLSVEAAVIRQDADSLPKSGSFASLASHGVPVICDAPDGLVQPPHGGFFLPREVMADPALLLNDEGVVRRRLLHDWFWSTRSWQTIGRDMHTWMAGADNQQSAANQLVAQLY